MTNQLNPWPTLNRMRFGRYAEAWIKMEFLRFGLDVYSPEVDDRGIDCLVRTDHGGVFEIQVKALRSLNYTFMRKKHFVPAHNLGVALLLVLDTSPPEAFLFPSMAWREEHPFLRDHDYEGKASEPEYGITLAKSTLPAMREHFALERVVRSWILA